MSKNVKHNNNERIENDPQKESISVDLSETKACSIIDQGRLLKLRPAAPRPRIGVLLE
jgi:hypothetical protein